MSAPAAAPAAAPPAAVLWDMDGTLVDTEPYWMESELELVAEFGGHWTEADARSIIGFDLLDGAAVLRQRGGVDLEPAVIVERLLDGVIARVRTHVPWRPGARRLLSELHAAGVPCALVTMSYRRLVDAVIEALDPIRFDAVITGDEVGQGKPHPEPYLRAAAALDRDPVQCVAIEDSPTGVASAGAAGCVVVAVPNLVAIEPAPGRAIVPTLKNVSVDDLGALVAATPPPEDLPPVGPDAGDGRRRGLLALGAIVAVLLVIAAIAVASRDGGDDTTVAPRQPGLLGVHAWVPYWALDDALADLETRADAIHQLSPLWFGATGVDTIEPDANTPADEAAEFLDLARQRGVPLVASVFDRTDAGVMASILADPDERARHVDALVSFAADNDVAGLDIDYEQFAFADGKDTWEATRPNWVAFVTELAERLHADGRLLTVSIPPVYDAGRTDDSGYWVYDYGAIAPVVDGIRVMAYDYSTASSDPGPIAPIEWVDRLVAGTSAAAGDPSKLVLGIPLYGYNWPIAVTGQCPDDAPGVTTVTERTVDALAAERGGTPVFDPVTYEWSFQYDLVVDDGTTSCTQRRQVNYVGADGAQQRMQRAVDAGFAGVALFALGYGDEAVWGAVDTIAAQLQPAGTGTTVPS